MSGATRYALFATALLPLLIAFSAASASTVSHSAPAAVIDVQLTGFEFSPKELTIQKGDTVRFTNKDPACHTVTRGDPANGPCTGSGSKAEKDFDIALNSTQSVEIKFNTVDTVSLYCKPHGPVMKMTITVAQKTAACCWRKLIAA